MGLAQIVMAGLFSLLFIGCGKPVCVMGMGECSALEQQIELGPVTVISDVEVIYASSSTSGPHVALLTITGGKPNYTVSITTGNTNVAYFLNGTTQTASLSGVTSRATLYAHNSVAAETNLTISVYDSSTPSKPGTFFIKVKP